MAEDLLMSVQNFRTNDFAEDVQIEFQQAGSLLRGRILWESMTGVDATFNVLGRTDPVPIVGLFPETPPPNNPAHTVRVVVPRRWADVTWEDPFEWLRQIVGSGLHPKYAQLIAAGLGRQIDIMILQRLQGTAIERSFDPPTGRFTDTVVAYPVGQKVLNDGRPFEVDKLIDAQEMLHVQSVPGNEVTCVITMRQRSQLMMDSKFSGWEYNDARPLKTDAGGGMYGDLGSYMGMRFVAMPEEMQAEISDGTIDRAVVFARMAVGFKEQRPLSTWVDTLPNRMNTVQMVGEFAGEGTRIQDRGVVIIESLRG